MPIKQIIQKYVFKYQEIGKIKSLLMERGITGEK